MPGAFDQTTITQVQQANDIVDVIGEHLSLKRRGREMVGLCPFHDDHKPSLNVNPAKQIFKCFACGAGGDVFKFVQMRENLTFGQAVERLADRAGIKTNKLRTKSSEPKTPDVDPNQLARVNAWAAKYFQNNLYDQAKGKHVLEYIAQRQITPESTKKWQLGLAIDSPDDLLRAARAKNIPTKLLEQAGLITAQNQDKFINRLMFTITDVTGRVIGFGGRTLDETGAKYINSPATALFDKSNSLYGLEQARHQIVSSGTAVVVEGYTDCIMAHQFGCSNVVASLGTSFTVGQARILRRYAKQAVLLFDRDAAGTEAANRALDVCLAQRIDIKLAFLPESKDPCEFLLASGKEHFEQLIDDAVDVLKFKWSRLQNNFTGHDTLTDRKAAIDEFLQTIATGLAANPIPRMETGLIVNQLSNLIGLTSKEITAELRRRTDRARRSQRYDQPSAPNRDIDYGRGRFAVAQREILEVLLNDPRLFDLAQQRVGPPDFDVPILKQVAAILFQTLGAEPKAPLTRLLAQAEDEELGTAFTDLQRMGQRKANYRVRLTDALETMQQYRTEMKKNQTKAAADPTEFLRSASEAARKDNPHSVGML